MIANIIIIAVVAVIFGLCVKKIVSGMKHGSCEDCSGNCGSCGGSCTSCGGNCQATNKK